MASNNRRFVWFFFAFALLLVLPAVVFAENAPVNAAAPIQLKVGLGTVFEVKDLSDYLLKFYNYTISVTAVLASFFITYAGFNWALAAGNDEKITKAKTQIKNSIVGMVLVLSAYVILNTISPALVTLKLPVIEQIAPELLASGPCPEPIASQNDCGYVVKNQPKQGEVCYGMKCTNRAAKCMQYVTPDAKNAYACMDTSKCPSNCDAIESAFPNWRQVCTSSLCKEKIPKLCYLDEGLITKKMDDCKPRFDNGDECTSSTQCTPPAQCDKSGVCAIPVRSLKPTQVCQNDNECESGVCNKAQLSGTNFDGTRAVAKNGEQGTCTVSGGIKNMPDKDSVKCEYDVAVTAGRESMCGFGWTCVHETNQQFIGDYKTGHCSELKLGSLCDGEVGTGGDAATYHRRPCLQGECKPKPGSATDGSLVTYTCQEKPAAPTTPQAAAGTEGGAPAGGTAGTGAGTGAGTPTP